MFHGTFSSSSSSEVDQPLNELIANLHAEAAAEFAKTVSHPGLRKVIIPVLKKAFPGQPSKKSKNTFLGKLKQINLRLTDHTPVDDEIWTSLIELLRSSPINQEEEKIVFYQLRNQIELSFPAESLLPSDDLDALILAINQRSVDQAITPAEYQKLLVQLKGQRYINDNGHQAIDYINQIFNPTYKSQTREPLQLAFFIQNMADIFKKIREAGLFTRINFIRLTLVAHTANIPSNSLNTIITAMADQRLLTHYNLEVLLKVLAFYCRPQAPQLTPQLFAEACKSLRYGDDFELKVKEWFNDPEVVLTEHEKKRIAPLDPNLFLNILILKLADHLSNIELQQYFNTSALTATDLNNIMENVKTREYAIAEMLVKLSDDECIDNDNAFATFMLAKNIRDISQCYTLLNAYNIYSRPQATLDALVPIAEYAADVYNLIVWLPNRTPEQCRLIIQHAKYAKDLLIVCSLEQQIDIHKTLSVYDKKFKDNLNIKQFLSSLREIYELLHSAKALTFVKINYLSELPENLLPAIAEKLKKAGNLSNSTYVDELFNQVCEKAIKESEQQMQVTENWLQQLNTCSLVTTTKKMVSNSNATFFITVDKNQHVQKISYSNVAFGIFEETNFSGFQRNTLPEDGDLTADALLKIQTTAKILHSNISEQVLVCLANPALSHIPLLHMNSLLRSYVILETHNLPEAQAHIIVNLIEQYPAAAVPLAKGLIMLLQEEKSEPNKFIQFITLLERNPLQAENIAYILIKLEDESQLNHINFLLLKNQIENAETIADRFKSSLVIQNFTTLLSYDDSKEQFSYGFNYGTTELDSDDSKHHSLRDELDGDDIEDDELDDDEEETNKNDDSDKVLVHSDNLSVSSKPTTVYDYSAMYSRSSHSSAPPSTSHVIVSKASSSASSTSDNSVNETTPLVSPNNQTDNGFLKNLIQRCREDYKTAGFFGGLLNRTTFLTLVDQRKITTLDQVKDYVQKNPRSRTARIYLDMLVKDLGDGRTKTILTNYFKDYQFSFFQRSNLVPKLLKNGLTQRVIEDHANESQCCLNRTAKVMKRRY